MGLNSVKNVDGNGAATPARRFGEVSKNLTVNPFSCHLLSLESFQDRTPARSFSSGSRSKVSGAYSLKRNRVRLEHKFHENFKVVEL